MYHFSLPWILSDTASHSLDSTHLPLLIQVICVNTEESLINLVYWVSSCPQDGTSGVTEWQASLTRHGCPPIAGWHLSPTSSHSVCQRSLIKPAPVCMLSIPSPCTFTL